MISFTQFQLHSSLSAATVKQKLTDFIDTGSLFKYDYTKGYTGQLSNDTFTLRKVYGVSRWYRGGKWEKVRIRDSRNGGDSYIGYGTITPEVSGTSLHVRMGLHRTTWIILGLFLLAPFGLSAWLSEGVGVDYVEFLIPGLVITAGLMLIFCTYYYLSMRLTARTIKRDLKALLDGTWEPLTAD